MSGEDPARAPPLIVELHVDELAFPGEDPARCFEATRVLLLAVAGAAEGVGARLCFRFREGFARFSAREVGGEPLRLLAERGHEVGVHAHGRRLREARDAVLACGLTPRCASPGMVQATDPARLAALWDETVDLGFSVVTDAPRWRAQAWAGHVPWRPGRGFSAFAPPGRAVCFEASIDPFAWGLLRRSGTEPIHARPLDASCFARLEALRASHARVPRPEGLPAFFLFTVHEHNFLAPGAREADPEALHGFAAFLGGCPGGTARAEDLAEALPAQDFPCRPPGRLPLPGLRRTLRRGLRRLLPRPEGEPFTVRVADRVLHALYLGPARPRALLLLSHAGRQGGTTLRLDPFGLSSAALVERSIAVVCFDRSGTGRSSAPGVSLAPGNPLHVEDLQAVHDALCQRVPGVPVGALSWSSGLLSVLRAGRRFAFVVDGEAPAERLSLRPPDDAGLPRDPRLEARALHEDLAWEGLEPARLLGGLSCPYHRLQGALDHVHGHQWHHASVMLDAARRVLPRVRCNGGEDLRPLPGRLRDHGDVVLGWLLDEVEGARG